MSTSNTYYTEQFTGTFNAAFNAKRYLPTFYEELEYIERLRDVGENEKTL